MKELGLPHITLDGGALLFKDLQLSRGQEEQGRLTAETIARSYDLMGYNAVGISRYELTAGLDFLIRLSREVKFSWLSANLVRKSNATAIFKPYITVAVHNLKIGIIGLTDPMAQNMLSDADAKILPWQTVLPPLYAKLKSQTDMLILLSSLPAVDNQKIAKRFNGIQLILQSGKGGGNIAPKELNSTLITQTASQGKYIGIMNIIWRNSRKWGIDKAGLLKRQQNSLGRLNWRISKYEKYNRQDKSANNNPNKRYIYKRLLKLRQTSAQEIKRLTEEIKSNHGALEPCTFKNRFIAMETSMPDDRKVKGLVDALNKKINAMGMAKARINKNLHKKYSGWQSCGTCHPKILTAWENTRHARAYETLVSKNRQFNLDCIYCHVTGINRKNAVDALSLGVSLREVGCEACHGPGKRHSKDPKQFSLIAKPAASLCRTCHTRERDDSFDYERDRKRIHRH
ncbi:MAG: hypothetical protein GXP59_09065 [Deltaproteobacteria bacterium]|nr:hypothetical protein [Deltaproteobacteria bacterium]